MRNEMTHVPNGVLEMTAVAPDQAYGEFVSDTKCVGR
jgi:hypothetical protein